MSNNSKHPVQLGYTMPAEWEPHYGTWLSYPHAPETFFDKLDSVRNTYCEMIKIIAEGEQVHVNVNDEEMKKDLEKRLADNKVTKNVHIHLFPTDDAWCRDHGAIFVKNVERGELAATVWKFNSWGEKYPYKKDAKIAKKMADTFKLKSFDSKLVFEGGSIDVNGNGVLLTTESCLLNPNRNMDLSREDIEKVLQNYFGVKKVLWLGEGIEGDDTDGHIDDISRFVNENTIVTVIEKDENDINFEPLKDNLERLITYTDCEGKPFSIVTLPMPDSIIADGKQMPASYANFYIANAAVIVPMFDCKHDKTVLEILRRYFPDRKVVGLPASDVVLGFGAFHCLTQQIPK
ncbi:MAG: agmatine deiminase family protein [Candidatus Ancaeobacter aquaticus]|nr:agmatine deiminase family protein [Candidatus Ancaeobacter aquaticus]